MSLILEKSPKEPIPQSEADLKELITKLLNSSVDVGAGGDIEDDTKGTGVIQKLIPVKKKVPVSQQEYNKILYYIERNIIGSGPIEPIIRDPYLEDIPQYRCKWCVHVHKIFGMLQTDITFGMMQGLIAGWRMYE
jgi:flagellar protein FlaI